MRLSSQDSKTRGTARGWSDRCGCLGLLVVALAACGGGQPEDSGSAASGRSASALTQAATQETSATPAPNLALQRGAVLNAQTLQDALQRAQSLPASTDVSRVAPGDVAAMEAYTQGVVAQKAEPVRVPVFRFYNQGTGAHFYTTSLSEREAVYSSLPNMNPEGEAFYAASAASPGLSPVHRFFNVLTGVHFYTISESERANTEANLKQFKYEGVAYYASLVPAAGFKPLYRFFVKAQGVHFYTAGAEESQSVQANLSATHSYEGVGYYVMDTACAAPPCGASGPNRPRVFVSLHGNNELANNNALDSQWAYVRQNLDGIWGNNAGITVDESARLFRKISTRNLITEYPVPQAGTGFLPLDAFTGIQRTQPDLLLNPEAIAFYTSDASRWNGRSVAQAEAIYTNPAAPAGQRYASVYTGWQPQNFDATNPKYLYPNPSAVLAFRSSKGTFLECPVGACTSGKLGESFRRAIRETHVRGRPFIWFASNRYNGRLGWLASFQSTYNAIAAENLWRSDDVIAVLSYEGAYPKVPESVGGVAADTATGLAYWALQQRSIGSLRSTLVNASTQRDLLPLRAGAAEAAAVSKRSAAGVDVRVDAVPAEARSVVLTWSQQQGERWVELHRRVDNAAPYLLFGGSGGSAPAVAPGNYRLRVQAFTEADGQGMGIAEREMAVNLLP